MCTNEQLIRDYLSNMKSEEIANSIHLIGINFERDSFDNIMNAIVALYLDVADTAKLITNDFVKSDGKILDNPDTRSSLIMDHELKSKVLNKLLDYQPIVSELSNIFQNEANNKIKQAS